MKNWKKLIAVAMAGAMSMSMLAACGSSSDSSAASSAPAAASSAAASSASSAAASSVEKKDGDVKIAYIVKAKTDEFWTTMETGAYAAAEEKGVTLEFQAPEKETDVEKQVQMVENAVVKGFDAIILSAADSTSLLPSIVKANNAGIPVVLVNDTIDMDELEKQGGKVETYVGISQYDAAAQAGVYAAENIEDGKICYLEGVPGVKALDDRLAGFQDQAPDFETVASQTAKCDRNEAYNVMQNVLNANPDVNVVWAVNAEMGQGAIQAIDQMKKTGSISVFDFDASSDDLAAIEAGTLAGTVAQYPNKQAEAAIQACLDVLDGKTLEEHTETPSLLVTAENLDEYKAEMGIE
ncbi:MAG: sugar ABC transporter substrate-binding protein [Eubacterium sp.]|nr:sugar ABC transporter substrate-binding protein [Eubacterium sp.]